MLLWGPVYLSVEKDVVDKDEDAEAGVEEDKQVLETAAGEEEPGDPVEAQVAGQEDAAPRPAACLLHAAPTPRVGGGHAAGHLQ